MSSIQTAALMVAASLISIFCIGILLGGGLFGSRTGARWRLNGASRFGPDLRDIGQQMRAVMAAQFQKQQLMNWAEFKAFRVIEEELAASARGYRVFAQVNLGEILTSPDDLGYRSINSKRIDILVVDRGGWPVLAVECQGAGHYQGTAAARDAIKKEALRKAGVHFMEVGAADTPDQIRAHVREQLGWPVKSPVDEAISSTTAA